MNKFNKDLANYIILLKRGFNVKELSVPKYYYPILYHYCLKNIHNSENDLVIEGNVQSVMIIIRYCCNNNISLNINSKL